MYYQELFGICSDLQGILVVNDKDVTMKNDDSNFEDATSLP